MVGGEWVTGMPFGTPLTRGMPISRPAPRKQTTRIFTMQHGGDITSQIVNCDIPISVNKAKQRF